MKKRGGHTLPSRFFEILSLLPRLPRVDFYCIEHSARLLPNAVELLYFFGILG